MVHLVSDDTNATAAVFLAYALVSPAATKRKRAEIGVMFFFPSLSRALSLSLALSLYLCRSLSLSRSLAFALALSVSRSFLRAVSRALLAPQELWVSYNLLQSLKGIEKLVCTRPPPLSPVPLPPLPPPYPHESLDIHTYLYAYIHTYLYAYIHAYACICIHSCACICIHACACMLTSPCLICMHARTYLYVQTHLRTHAHTHTRTRVHTHTHTHTHR